MCTVDTREQKSNITIPSVMVKYVLPEDFLSCPSLTEPTQKMKIKTNVLLI